ncbi:MAG: DUF1330 domain-containing protein [Rubrivivax sp.]|nr:DUF1330 domain-containing protein [Rubrivivax sp.]
MPDRGAPCTLTSVRRHRSQRPAAYEDYRRQAPALIAAHDGRLFGARRCRAGVGRQPYVPHRRAILEFPDTAHLQASTTTRPMRYPAPCASASATAA